MFMYTAAPENHVVIAHANGESLCDGIVTMSGYLIDCTAAGGCNLP